MIDAERSTTGNPLMVGGPQIGYFYPGLTYEIDMNAPGLRWRGATTAPFPGYLLIGRGVDFATAELRPAATSSTSSPSGCAAEATRCTATRASAGRWSASTRERSAASRSTS